MKGRNLDMSDAPVFCPDVPDYRAEAFAKAKELAKTFGVAYVLFNGLYYHVTVSSFDVTNSWRHSGYKVIHIEYSKEYKRICGIK